MTLTGIRDRAEFIAILLGFRRHNDKKRTPKKNARYLRLGTGRIRGHLKEASPAAQGQSPLAIKKLHPNVSVNFRSRNQLINDFSVANDRNRSTNVRIVFFTVINS